MEPRPCEICGKDIPFNDKNGKPLNQWKYEQRKTCGSTCCYSDYHTMKRQVHPVEPYVLTPMDLFIRGAI